MHLGYGSLEHCNMQHSKFQQSNNLTDHYHGIDMTFENDDTKKDDDGGSPAFAITSGAGNIVFCA